GLPWELLRRNRVRAESGSADVRYSQVYQDNLHFVSEESHGLDPVRHLAWCRQRMAEGCRPVALSVTARAAASVWHRPVVPDAAKEALARRQAQAAVMLLQLGDTTRVRPLLRHRPDPRLRTWIVHKLSPLGSDPRVLVRWLGEEKEVSVRRALLWCL